MSRALYSLPQRAAAEFVGSAALTAIVVGSGIMGKTLGAGDDAVALLANSLATGAGLVALLFTFGAVSGAQFNPVVTVAEAVRGALPARDAAAYVVAQGAGTASGVVLAHLMFGLPAISTFARPRNTPGELLAEVVATAGLLLAIRGAGRARPEALPFVVAAYITAAYWFTSSTSFANPAVALARSLTGTFAGIRLVDVPGFVGAEAVGAAVGVALDRLWRPASESGASA